MSVKPAPELDPGAPVEDAPAGSRKASLAPRGFRHLVFATLEGRADTTAARVINSALAGLIVLNVAAVVIETVPGLPDVWHALLRKMEVFSVTVFTLEYVTRIWSCTSDPRFRGSVLGRLRFAVTPLALIDLIAVLPFYVPVRASDLRVLRAFRLVRLLRVFKMARYSESLRSLGRAVASRREQLLTTMAVVLLLLVVSATFMHTLENEAQPEQFKSIPHAMWWGVSTLTTVGYGDVFPVTVAGRILGAFVQVLGIGIFALPTAILGSAFLEQLQSAKPSKKRCPHCGKDLRE